MYNNNYYGTLPLFTYITEIPGTYYNQYWRRYECALDSVISLLEHSSELVNLFNDGWYINSTNDPRLQKFNNFYSGMCHWEEF